MSLAPAQMKQPGDGRLAFFASGTNEFAFDTGVLKASCAREANPQGCRRSCICRAASEWTGVWVSLAIIGYSAPTNATAPPPGIGRAMRSCGRTGAWKFAGPQPKIVHSNCVRSIAGPRRTPSTGNQRAGENGAGEVRVLPGLLLCGRLHECVRLCALKQPGMAQWRQTRMLAPGRHSRATTRLSPSFRMGAGSSSPTRLIG